MCLFEHARFPVKGNESNGEAFFGDIVSVVLLVLEYLFDPWKFLGGGEAADGGHVDAGFCTEAVVVAG